MITPEQRAELDTCVKGLHDGANITMDAGTIRSLLSALEEAEAYNKDWRKLWVKQQGQRWQAIETLAATRKQLAEAQQEAVNDYAGFVKRQGEEIARLTKQLAEAQARELGLQKYITPEQRKFGNPPATGDTSALQSAIAEAVEPYKRDAERLSYLIDTSIDFYPSAEGSSTKEPDLYLTALNLGAGGVERHKQVRAEIDAALASQDAKLAAKEGE